MTRTAAYALALATLCAPLAAQSAVSFPLDVVGQECFFELDGTCTTPADVTWTLQADGSFLDRYNYGGDWLYDSATGMAAMQYAMDFDGDGTLDFAYDYVGTVADGCVQGPIYDEGVHVGIWGGCFTP